MNHETSLPWLFRRMLRAPVWAVVLATLALPVAAEGDAVLHGNDVRKALGNAVVHHYKKTRKRRTVESACYFDPAVEKSMACSWSSGSGGAGRVSMAQRVQRNGVKWCKKRGGSDCTLFLKNGKLKYDSLSADDSARLESILSNIPSYDSVAHPLPEGVEVGSSLRERFGEVRDYWEGQRKKRRAYNMHYAICASDRDTWATASQEGGGTAKEGLSEVREMCISRCKAAVDWFEGQGKCYAFYEDGKFASVAAERAVSE